MRLGYCLALGCNLLAVQRRQEAMLKRPAGYDPYDRFGAALIANAIKTARNVERPATREMRVSALKAIAWLASPELAQQWFDLAGFEYTALVDRLPLEHWVKRGHELLTSDADLRKAVG